MSKNIMIQGTMSNVGKSFIVTALLRFLKNKGIKAAPFKSQNMALNSFITRDGSEIGRAQAVQAMAAGIEPDYRMNPILLKPSSDKGSQIILNGKAIGEKSASEYFLNKKAYVETIMEDYDSLSKEYDCIVIEGAGSPAEMNLKEDDIVNMGLAEMVDAPVLLVGDINPGGVFAQLYGTLALLEDDERERVKGLIVNKFRGDKSLFKTGIDFLEEKTKKKVLGVLPYADVLLEAEDSLVTDDRADFYKNNSLGASSEDQSTSKMYDSKLKGNENIKAKTIDIAIINLPWASNLTDFEPLSLEKNVDVLFVSSSSEIGTPDVIIIPGTKNTMHDTRWLFETGLADRIIELNKAGVPVVGICGGYQILGERLLDPKQIDHDEDSIEGLKLLPIETVFDEEKKTINTKGKINALPGIFSHLSGINIKGYEIHMGRSRSIYESAGIPFISDNRDCSLGCVRENVLGTYLHGLFENDEFRSRFLHIFASADNNFSYQTFRDEQFDKMASLIEQNLDMNEILNIIHLEFR